MTTFTAPDNFEARRRFFQHKARIEEDANHRGVPHCPLGVDSVEYQGVRYALRWIEPGSLSKTMSFGVAITNCQSGQRLLVNQVMRTERTRKGVTTVRYSAMGQGWRTRQEANAGLVALVADRLHGLVLSSPVTGSVLVPVAVAS